MANNMSFGQVSNIGDFLAGSGGNYNTQDPGLLQKILSGGEQVLDKGGELMADPNIQRALAEMGAEIDPQGVGGTVGRAAQGMVKRGALSELAGQGNRVKVGPDGSIDVTPQQGKEGGTQGEGAQEGTDKSRLAGEETQEFNLDDITTRINQMIGE